MAPEKHGRQPSRHARPDAELTALENARLQQQAAELVAELSGWLAAPLAVATPLDEADPDLVEWCRKARDILEAVRDA
jgi:hypothetical protein